MTTTLDLKHPEKAGTLGAGLFHLDAEVKNKFSQVKQRIPGDGSMEHKGEDQQVVQLLFVFTFPSHLSFLESNQYQ